MAPVAMAAIAWLRVAAWALLAFACVGAPAADAGESGLPLDIARHAYRDGRYEAAAKQYRAALADASADAQRRMAVLYELGRTEVRLHSGEQALATLRESLALAEASPGRSPAVVAYIQLTIADALRESGQLEAARSAYSKVLDAFQGLGILSGQGEAHAGLGSALLLDARFAEALEEYRQALQLLSQAAPGEAGALRIDMASLFSWLGKYDEARTLIDEADRLCEQQPPAACGAYVDHARSLLAFNQGHYQQAAAAARNAATAFGDAHPTDRARALNNLGIALVGLKRPDEAIAALSQALAAEAAGDPRDVAATTDSMGAAWRLAGRPDRARHAYEVALLGWQRLGNREGQRDTLANLGELAASQHEFRSAILFYKLSVNLAQSLRADARGLDPAYRATLSRRLSPAYRALAALLVDQGRLAEANQVSRMLKEDERYEFLRGGDVGDTTASLAGAEVPEAEHFGGLANDVFAMAVELRALNAKESMDLTDTERQRIATLDKQLDLAANDLDRFLEELEAALSRQRHVAPPQESVNGLLGIQRSLEQLGHGAVLLRYVLLEDDPAALRIVLVSPDARAIQGFKVDVPAVDVNRAVAAFRQAIDRRDVNVASLARQLHGWLFPPALRTALDAAHAKTLMVALDGALRYLPIAALRDEKGWLIERYPIALFDDAGKSRLEHAPRDAWSVQAFGMTQAAFGLRELTGVRAELDGIISDASMPGRASYDDEFTRDHLHDAVYVAKPSVLHIASHFVLKMGLADESFLLLGQGRLTLAELQHWDFGGLELMTLSACDTAADGGSNASGREIESFAAMVQERGAYAVLAALWPVYDPSTAAFMRSFYAQRHAPDGTLRTKAEALQAAQLAMIRNQPAGLANAASGAGRGTVEGVSPAPADYSQPYYWAPFVLLGDWR